MISQEYVGAIVILLVSVLKLLGIEIGSDVLTSLITSVIAIWVAVRRYQKRDINIVGVKKY